VHDLVADRPGRRLHLDDFAPSAPDEGLPQRRTIRDPRVVDPYTGATRHEDVRLHVVRTRFADLDDVATAFHQKHDRKMRVATKYLNLTRAFFSEHGVADYRIVESLGATEGAPAAGSAELIVDITTTGATLAANGLRVLDDGVMLRSQANLVASRTANWGQAERDTVRTILDRIAAQARAKAFREVRARFPGRDNALFEDVMTLFGVVAPFGGPTSSGMLTLHCPPEHVASLATVLRERGAETVSVSSLDYVFGRDNPLYAKLEAGLTPSVS